MLISYFLDFVYYIIEYKGSTYSNKWNHLIKTQTKINKLLLFTVFKLSFHLNSLIIIINAYFYYYASTLIEKNSKKCVDVEGRNK